MSMLIATFTKTQVKGNTSGPNGPAVRNFRLTSQRFLNLGTFALLINYSSEAVCDRTACGKQLLQFRSKKLTAEFGKGLSVQGLRNMRHFCLACPIRYALRSELTWIKARH